MSFAILFIVVFVAYMAPALVAQMRGHRNVNAICFLNIALGWTFLGWALAFVWALTAPERA